MPPVTLGIRDHSFGLLMLGRILGAVVGQKLASRNNRASGALLGAAIPFIARRGLGPLGLALGAGWAAKKLYDRNRVRSVAPVAPVVETI